MRLSERAREWRTTIALLVVGLGIVTLVVVAALLLEAIP